MKITRLSIHNFLKLKDIEINPSSQNIIVGKNKQGKTSILKAIKTAFTGDADSTSIRVGGDKAEITIELDQFNIKRTITQKGSYVDISNKDGMKMPAPQKWLNGVLGVFSFNPIEFFELKPSDRKKYLLGAINITITPERLKEYTGEDLNGLDFNSHALEVVENARKFYYDKRTFANAEKSKKQKTLDEMMAKVPNGFEPDLQLEANIRILRNEVTNAELSNQKRNTLSARIANSKVRIAQLKEELEREEVSLRNDESELEHTVLVDVSKIETELESLDLKLKRQTEIAFDVKRTSEVRAELNDAVRSAGRLDDIVKRLTKELPEKLIAEAKLPIDGLSVSEGDVFINGVSIDNLSSSEQIKLGLQVVRALNNDFKVICIDGVEKLDKESFEFFLKETENDDYQYFVTRVDGDNSKHSITIEDGLVKEQ